MGGNPYRNPLASGNRTRFPQHSLTSNHPSQIPAARRVREIGAVNLAPGRAVVSAKVAEQELRTSVVSNRADDRFAIAQVFGCRLWRKGDRKSSTLARARDEISLMGSGAAQIAERILEGVAGRTLGAISSRDHHDRIVDTSAGRGGGARSHDPTRIIECVEVL
jgi:hypothetical protein